MMKFTLKRNHADSAMIEAYMDETTGNRYLAFIVHEDMVGHEILEALSDSGGDKIECYLTVKCASVPLSEQYYDKSLTQLAEQERIEIEASQLDDSGL